MIANYDENQRSNPEAGKQADASICTVCHDPACWGEYTHYEDPDGGA